MKVYPNVVTRICQDFTIFSDGLENLVLELKPLSWKIKATITIQMSYIQYLVLIAILIIQVTFCNFSNIAFLDSFIGMFKKPVLAIGHKKFQYDRHHEMHYLDKGTR